MLNFKWRVGVAMSSSKCKSLAHPYVLISFDIKEVDGSITHHSAELTFDQFKVCWGQFFTRVLYELVHLNYFDFSFFI